MRHTRKPARQRQKPKRFDPALEEGVRAMKRGDSMTAAAARIGVSPSRFRVYLKQTGVARKVGQRWKVGRDRRFREMALFSRGRESVVTVDAEAASRIGSYASAVREFLSTDDPSVLLPFEGESIRDRRGRRHVFETRPNVIYRLAASEQQPFEQVYRIVA
jgi:hypothetical protein